MTNELWKIIDEVPHYMVSNEGRVMNTLRGRVLKPSNSGKYLSVTLVGIDKRRYYRSVHKLVAMAFVPNPNNLPQVNHIDETRHNNFATNLEWVTAQENSEYSNAGHYVMQDPDGNVHHIFNMAKFCRENDLNKGNMFSVVHGRFKQSMGWTKYNY